MTAKLIKHTFWRPRRHALQSEWPYIIIIIMAAKQPFLMSEQIKRTS